MSLIVLEKHSMEVSNLASCKHSASVDFTSVVFKPGGLRDMISLRRKVYNVVFGFILEEKREMEVLAEFDMFSIDSGYF